MTMKARKAAKIIKRDWNTDRLHSKEWAYLLRVTRRWYLNLARKAKIKGDIFGVQVLHPQSL